MHFDLYVVFHKVCVLVTTAFVLTLLPGFGRTERPGSSMGEKGPKLLIFVVLGLVEEVSVGGAGWFNHRIIAACAAGLLAGPGVGIIVATFVTSMAVAYDGRPLAPLAVSTLCGGLAGGLLHQWKPKLARHPPTGFCLTAAISFIRDIILGPQDVVPVTQLFQQLGVASLFQGLGTAFILMIAALVRDRDEQIQAAASAEVSSLQSRMNPHFLFNALNTVAALSRVTPGEARRAVHLLHRFLRASHDQDGRALVPLEEELSVVRMYLDIENLRFSGGLKVEERVGAGLSNVLVPPFSLQLMVENGVVHGLRPSKTNQLLLVVRAVGWWLEMSVTDGGRGVPSTEVESIFFAEGQRAHALTLLRRRLRGLYGHSFKLQVRSAIGEGTTVLLGIPLQKSEDAKNGRSYLRRMPPDEPAQLSI